MKEYETKKRGTEEGRGKERGTKEKENEQKQKELTRLIIKQREVKQSKIR